MIKNIDEKEFELEVLNYEGEVVVEFFATWCGLSKMMEPVLNEVKDEIEGIKFLKIDIDKNQGLVKEYAIQSVPTIKVFKSGKEVSTIVGCHLKESLIEKIKESF